MSGHGASAGHRRSLIAALGAWTVLAVLTATAGAQLIVEDQAKRVAFQMPKGFVVDAESSSDELVLLGPKLSGGQARLELHRLAGELPTDVALIDFMEPLFGDAEAVPWERGEAPAPLAAAFIAEHKRKRKLVRTAVAAGRHGPSVVALVAEAPPALFDQLADDWGSVLDSFELVPHQPLFRDEAMGVSVHTMPDWMEADAEGTQAGQRATWRWTSADKTLTATVVIEAGGRVPDLEAWAAEREQAFERLGEVSGVERTARHVAGRQGIFFEVVYGSGSTQWIRATQNEGHLIQVICTSPSSMLEESFASVFEAAVAGLSLDDP